MAVRGRVILVMEDKHRTRLLADFANAVEGKTVHVLEIPDEYPFMDPEPVEQLEASVAALLGPT